MRILRAYYAQMKNGHPKKSPKKAINLSLSDETIRMGNALQKPLLRRSLTSVIEFAVAETWGRHIGFIKKPNLTPHHD